MSLWGYNKPPPWCPTALITDAGWVHPDTGELLVAISNLPDKRLEFLDIELPLYLFEDGSFITLEQDLGNDQGADLLVLG